MRNSRIYLDDIIDAMEKIEVFTPRFILRGIPFR